MEQCGIHAHDPGDTKEQDNPQSHSQHQAYVSGFWLLMGRKFGGDDAKENDVVNP